ncbi:MAG: ATP-binding protein [Planctomycetota bacterium]
MNDLAHLTREQAIAELERVTLTSEKLLHELRVHQTELVAQNEELRHTQTLLEESRNRYADLYDFAPIALLVLDSSGVIRGINLAGVTLLGADRARVIGLPLVAAVSLQSSRIFFAHLRETLETDKSRTGELVFTVPGGRRYVVHVVSTRFVEPEGQMALWMALTDVTEQKHAIEMLADSEGRFHQLADAMPQIVLSAGPDGAIDYYNQRWVEFTGFAAGEHGDRNAWFALVHPEDRDRARDLWGEAMRTGKAVAMEPRLWDRKTSSHRWHLVRAVPVHDRGGAVLRWFATATDIHDQKRAQHALEEAHQRKDEFLAMLAHELRNPLAPLATAAHLIKAHEKADPSLKRLQQVIDRQVRHLTRLVNDLLDVARMTSGKVRLEKRVVDAGDVIAAAVETVRPLVDARRQCLTVTGPEEPTFIDADPARLGQVIANLLNNATKYTPEGGEIVVSAEHAAGELVIRVRDTGVGIAADMLPRIFDIFTQADRSLDRAQGGLGIGLALVKQLVAMHGGRVAANSLGVGLGSEFVVTVPARETAPAPVADTSVPGDALRHHAPMKILVIDDNVDLAEMLAEVLQTNGHEVRIAHDGPTGIRVQGEFQAELIILDIGLPGMNGYDVARTLRRSMAPGVVLVAVTGYGQESDRLRAHEAGFDHHVVKPLQLEVLDALVGAVPDAGHDRRETGH